MAEASFEKAMTRKCFTRNVSKCLLLFGVVTVVLVNLSILIGAFERCGSATFQEGNPFPFIAAMDEMKAQGSDIAIVHHRNEQTWLMKVRMVGADEDALARTLKAQGWHFADQHGTLHIFQRGRERLNIHCRMFSRDYQACSTNPRQFLSL